jgi:hypothetical protein
VSTKGKIFDNTLLSLQLERFEDVLLNIFSFLCCSASGLIGVQRPLIKFEGAEIK